MKKSLIVVALLTSCVFAFDLKSIANEVAKSIPTQNQQTSNKSLDNTTVSNGLKDALKVGVKFATSELGKENGYLNNKNVRIPLPNNLANAESIIRKIGGDKIADDLIKSMNNAASKAAPKTVDIFLDAISKMSLSDATNILNGGNSAATDYFRKNSTNSLKSAIKPIVQQTLKENSVAKYYDIANNFFQSKVNSSPLGSFLGTNSQESLDDFVTTKAIEGLFTMIAQKESSIRANPTEQTTSLLKKVFGK